MALHLIRREASDERLMRRVQTGDTEAFEQLYDRHAVRAFRVARSVCDASRAEDAVQEGFLSIWRSRESYRPESGSFQAWSMRIVRNRAIDAARRDAARPPLADSDHHDPEDTPAPTAVEQDVIARDEADGLRGALKRLPDEQAEVIALAYYGELTHTQIAKQLSIPSGTVKGRMRLGLEKLRRQLEVTRPGEPSDDMPASASG